MAAAHGARWSPARFLANPERRLLQPCGEGHDPYAIYEVELELDSPDGQEAPAVTGKGVLVASPEGDGDSSDDSGASCEGALIAALEAAAIEAEEAAEVAAEEACAFAEGPSWGWGACRAGRGPNKYVRGMLDALRRRHASVAPLPCADALAREALLTSNVVFLRLLEGAEHAACDTCAELLDCVARATPVLVNRLPALERLLGADYPGFYDALGEAAGKAADMEVLLAAHSHLARLRLPTPLERGA